MKKTLAVFLLTALVLSLSGCAMRQEIIDWIVSISAEESIPGMESGAVIETVLGDRLPIAAGEVDLKEGEVEEKNGYLLYRFYALTTADATDPLRWAQEMNNAKQNAEEIVLNEIIYH